MPMQHRIIESEASYALPAAFSREIGRIIVRWAYLEHKVQRAVWTLAQLTFPIGRTVAREPRIEDRIAIIEQLAELRGIDLNEDILKGLKEGAKLIAHRRDTIAHGFWHKQPDGWHVAITRGKWADPGAPTRYKHILPESSPVTTRDLAKVAEGVKAMIDLFDIIARQIAAKIQPPPEVHPEQFPRRRTKSGRNPSKREKPH